ncbi:hypothetical protein LguiA_030730 [Lonicera macranthoides]
MDNRLLETARLGNVHLLSQLLQENPLLLSEVFLLSPNENPLHVATKANQLNFVHEIMKIKPELANELNNHGFRPLDIASACGHVEIVKALLVSDAPRLKGREGRTALHYAALKGRVEVINELVSACSDCVKDATIVGETALHLAAKYYQIEALKTLIEWVDAEKHGLEETGPAGAPGPTQVPAGTIIGIRGMVDPRTCEAVPVARLGGVGRTRLSLRVYLEMCALTKGGRSCGWTLLSGDLHGQFKGGFMVDYGIGLGGAGPVLVQGGAKTVELLLGSRLHTTNKLLQLNAMNSKGLTPMDIVDILTESSNNTSIPPKLTKILQDAGALRAKDIVGISPAPVPAVAPPDEHPSKQDWFTYFKFQPDRDPPGETRDALLVVFALIVTITFEALIDPPSLLDKDDTSVFNRSTFLFFNTLGFAAAVTIIEYLMDGFPFQRELRAALLSLGWAYGVVYPTHKGTNYNSLYDALFYIAIFLPMALRELPKLIRKCFGCKC